MQGFKEVDTGRFNFPKIGIGLIGYGFMGKAHTNAYKKLSYFSWPPVAIPELVAVYGLSENETITQEAAYRYGYKGYYNDSNLLVNNSTIQLVDNCTPDDMHCEPCIAAAKAGKHIICEKPLAMKVADAKRMYEAARKANVKHMLGHNYRFIPAVRLAKEMIQNGLIGEIYEFRGRYLQSVGAVPKTQSKMFGMLQAQNLE